ncbi:hypothetical protein Scep_000688 [Stephania cephalantha]|uniref:NmrA-like domain-containing protein n=1 Tax=Stephania cephalantha TaxID=152367 RepID=A0AAP0L840_9MAGN
MEVNKSKILIVGATEYIGNFIVEASVNAGHSAYAFVRETTVSDPTKAMLIKYFKSRGVDVVFGDLNDHESLVKGIKLVDVVISAVGHLQCKIRLGSLLPSKKLEM